MQARYQDPVIGRFLSIDPVGFMPSKPYMFNRYAYVGNNPFGATDPTGMADDADTEEVVVTGYPEEDTERNNGSGWTPEEWMWGVQPSESDVAYSLLEGAGLLKQCVSQCLASNYGSIYTVANYFNPLGTLSVSAQVWSTYTNSYSQPRVTRSLYTHSSSTFPTGVRQAASLRTLGQLNVVGAVTASFALPFTLTAEQVCKARCD